MRKTMLGLMLVLSCTPVLLRAQSTTARAAAPAGAAAARQMDAAVAVPASAYERLQVPASVMADDVDNAFLHIRWAWGDYGPCTRLFLCATYIDDVGISFSDGNFGVHVGVQRLTTSAHDCIQHAKDALRDGNKGLAVEWVMASQIHNPPVKDWLRTHGDAVVAALGRI